MEVPTKSSLAEIYPEDAIESQSKRWQRLVSTFRDTYGKSPDFVSRSPGRVNIIGEVYHYSHHLRGEESTERNIAHRLLPVRSDTNGGNGRCAPCGSHS